MTVVLIGAETSERKYVGTEIAKSHTKDNVLLGIYIHNNMEDQSDFHDVRGQYDTNSDRTPFSRMLPRVGSGVKRETLRRREPNRAKQARWRARKRVRDSLPKRVKAVLKKCVEMVKRAGVSWAR